MRRKISLLIVVCLTWAITGNSQGRKVENINADWGYLEKPFQSPEQIGEKESWLTIDLPHTWNNEDVVDLIPGYRRSVSWYKKSLSIDKIEKGKRLFLSFEGVNIVTEVFVNGQKSGGHIGGYLAFDIEITDFINSGTNEVLVKVDNGYDRQVIPSQKSDFFIYGGITRDVWLKTVSSTFIDDVTVTDKEVTVSNASMNVSVDLNGKVSSKYDVQLTVIDPKGNTVETFTKSAEEQTSFDINIARPSLWSVDMPSLYGVEVTLVSKGEVIDESSDRFGARWFEFKQNGPFYLNGERLLLRGTHRHEEHAGYGAAMPNALHRKDIEMIKSMGANFVRLAHYPQDPEVYKACDELGILIWDEVPWCRGGVGDDVWKTNTNNMLTEMIDQNFNHPSIILWSLGNEIYWLPDFEGGDDTDALNAYLSEMNDLAHELDPTRKTAIRKYYAGSDIVDVFSPSIWSGWYSGSYTNYKKVVDKSISDYDHFFHMEYGGSSHFGRHTENPITGEGVINPDHWEEEVNQLEVQSISKSGDWSENYIVDLFDWYLGVSETHDQFVGNAQWAYKDFGTPLRPENDIPYMNQKGLADRDGNPKDAYFVFKSYWSTDPFSYIESHTWTERAGPEGVSRNVCVYSNNEEVELFLNGESLGMKSRDIKQFPACGLNWDLNFESGENALYSVGYFNGIKVSEDSMKVNYSFEKADTPNELKLSSELLDNGNYLVSVTAIDKKGRRCLDYEERVYFQCLSGGTLIKNLGTPTGSESIKMANGLAAIEVKPDAFPGLLQMTVLNQNFKGSFLEIEK